MLFSGKIIFNKIIKELLFSWDKTFFKTSTNTQLSPHYTLF